MRHSFEHLGFCCTQKTSTGFSHNVMQMKVFQKEHVCLCQSFRSLDITIIVQHIVLLHPLILVQQLMMRGLSSDPCHIKGREEILPCLKTPKKRFSSLPFSLSHLKCSPLIQIPVTRQPELILSLFCWPLVARKYSLTDKPVAPVVERNISLVSA